MLESANLLHVQRVIDAAQQDQTTQHIGGFIIVQWHDRYSAFATAMPHASLDDIVGFSTLAHIHCRYRLTADGWQEINVGISPPP